MDKNHFFFVEMNSEDAKWCKDTLEKVMKSPISSPFIDPVEGVPDYNKVISKVMCFSMIKENLESHQYSSVDQFLKDIKLIYDNCKKFNGEMVLLTFMAKDILMEVMEMYAEKIQSKNNDWYQHIGQLSIRIQKLMQTVPDQFLDNPEWQKKELPLEKQNTENQQLVTLVGEKYYKKLAENWPAYNADTKKAIYQNKITV